MNDETHETLPNGRDLQPSATSSNLRNVTCARHATSLSAPGRMVLSLAMAALTAWQPLPSHVTTHRSGGAIGAHRLAWPAPFMATESESEWEAVKADLELAREMMKRGAASSQVLEKAKDRVSGFEGKVRDEVMQAKTASKKASARAAAAERAAAVAKEPSLARSTGTCQPPPASPAPPRCPFFTISRTIRTNRYRRSKISVWSTSAEMILRIKQYAYY